MGWIVGGDVLASTRVAMLSEIMRTDKLEEGLSPGSMRLRTWSMSGGLWGEHFLRMRLIASSHWQSTLDHFQLTFCHKSSLRGVTTGLSSRILPNSEQFEEFRTPRRSYTYHIWTPHRSAGARVYIALGSMADITIDLELALTVATDLAIQAGEQLLARAQQRITPSGAQLTIVQKLNAVDLVTEADEDAENIIRNGLKKHFPDHSFVGEESYGQGMPNNQYIVGDEPTWVVDPLDGTVSNIGSNYVLWYIE